MPKVRPVKWQLFEKFLLHVGCVLTRREGSHRIYWKEGLNRPIILQGKSSVPVFIITNNLRTLGINRNEYLRMMAQL